MKANFLKNKNLIYWTIFVCSLLLLLILQYYGVVYFRYPDTPGDDTYNHWNMIRTLKESGYGLLEAFSKGGYPPFYHYTISKISLLLHLPEMTVMLWTYPAIIVFASLSAFLLAYAVFENRWVALLAFLLYGFTTQTPIQLLHDGGYPNLIAAHIFLPLAISMMILAWRSNMFPKKIALYAGALIPVLLIFLTHHISTFEMIGLAITSTPILLLFAWIKNKWACWKSVLLFALYFLILFLIGFAYLKSPLFAPFRGLASIMIEITSQFPFIRSLIKPENVVVVPWRNFPGWIGWVIVPFGLLYIPIFALFKNMRQREYFYPLVFMSVWPIMLLVFSQSYLLTNPERLARDSALPLSILAAGCIYNVGRYLWLRKILFAIFVTVFLALAYSPLKSRLYKATHYEPMVRVTQADIATFDILKSMEPSPILTNTWFYYYQKYFPDWPITYAPYLSQEQQQQMANPMKSDSDNLLRAFKYIYIVDSQLGWAPEVQFDLAIRYIDNPNFILLTEHQCSTNHVYLFENKIFVK